MRGLLAVLLLVIVSSAGAASLGRLAVLSAIGEPLRAENEVSVSPEEHPGRARVRRPVHGVVIRAVPRIAYGVMREENYSIPCYSYRRLLKGNFVPHPATFLRRRVFQRVGLFDESLRYAMDYDMWLRVGRVRHPVQLNEHLAVFRAHEASLSSANPMATFVEDFRVRMRHAPSTPWDWACHLGHYWVRRRRIERGLRASGISP